MNSIALMFIALALFPSNAIAQVNVKQYDVYEVSLQGENYTLKDNPVRDIELTATWKHESGSPIIRIYGFYDGDGKGGASGNVFKVRFCPTTPGKWALMAVSSNDKKLNGQKAGFIINCIPSEHPGFWVVDKDSSGGRWYKRSNGNHTWFTGNTMYTFVSGYFLGKPVKSDIAANVKRNADYFKKIRFGITGDIYPNPKEKPFIDLEGNLTDEGNYSFRPNPKWFGERVDLAVREMHNHDVIADIIMNGPDSYDSRSALLAKYNGGDPFPFLRYMAARYGSYPNVWFCLSNEYNIKNPRYTEEQAISIGHMMKSMLPYNNPLSIHPNQQDWDPRLNSLYSWNDHVIIQNKIKTMGLAADKIELNYWKGNRMPVINDELAYEGKGDGWLEEDVIEAFLGAFLGGGYASTGHKSGSKKGHYFAGAFSAEEHSAADNLKWMADKINANINFWRMKPATVFFTRPDGTVNLGIFFNVDFNCRMLARPGEEFAIGFNAKAENIEARLPQGSWKGVLYDMIAKKEIILGENIEGRFSFDVPASRAVLVHFKRN